MNEIHRLESVRARLREHYLAQIICDHETKLDNPVCACSLVHLGWHASVGAAVAAWIDHAVVSDGLDAITAENKQLKARVAEYENAISWGTSCLACSRMLDSSIAEHERAEQAEDEVERLKAHQQPDGGQWLTYYGAETDDHGGFSLDRYKWDTHQFRVWTGRIQPIPSEKPQDVLATPDPDSATQTTP